MDSLHPPPPERRDEPGLALGLVASFTPWYTSHKGAQEGEMGCQKAELAYLHGFRRPTEERWQLTELLTP